MADSPISKSGMADEWSKVCTPGVAVVSAESGKLISNFSTSTRMFASVCGD